MYAIRSYYDRDLELELALARDQGGDAVDRLQPGVDHRVHLPGVLGHDVAVQRRTHQGLDDVITSYSIHYTKLYDGLRAASRRSAAPSFAG